MPHAKGCYQAEGYLCEGKLKVGGENGGSKYPLLHFA